MTAEIITIGDEILIGQIVDTNSAWMAQKLNLAGIAVKQITSVSDQADHIIDALSEAEKRAGIILITGGLGPTKDDITKITLSRYFNMGMRRDEETLQHVRTFFERLKRPMLDSNMGQADVPEGCTVIQNKQGTAPCMWFENNGRIIVSMPGVPFEMMYLMEEEIIPRLVSLFKLPHIVHKTILTYGIGESFLAEAIADIENDLPEHIKLAYLPRLGQVRLRLSGSGYEGALLDRQIMEFTQRIAERVKKHVAALEDIALEKAMLNTMEKRGLTLSTAESCTGGYIGHLITQHPGSSAVYKGGGVVYSNELKIKILDVSEQTLERYGAVSEETVTEMAAGALRTFNTDYAVAVSGIAGPDGASPGKPVGTVWIAVANKQQVVARLFTFGNKRTQNIERSAVAALGMILNELGPD
ncbi:competence/damage-inducible protein A [Pedobacter deserti]|uniref:competence/damage-inducible protein A n=1 Tax=Pedobacter deserti TaxID=2817382 RepID=UPI00210D944A|nr:competence/damage-inducible protein A [Pedobacter sp. SYSU D00382]